MKICFIGACGHSRQAYNYLCTRSDVEFCAMAPGSVQESLTESFDPSIPFYNDYKQMLDIVQPDLAVISPVFAQTGSVIIECAKRGIDVFSEKPVAATAEELESVACAVRDSNIRFCAMHYLRYDPAFYHGAQLVKSGQIGQVRLVTAQKSYKYGTRPAWYGERALYGGTIPWVGIHAIDWIYHFTGKRFLSVSAQSFGESPEMAAVCQFQMEDGVISAVNLDFYRPQNAETHGDDRIRCMGTEGALEIRDGKIYLINQNGCTVTAPTEAPELLADFIDGRETLSPDEIFYLTGVAIAARDSADQNRTIGIGEML